MREQTLGIMTRQSQMREAINDFLKRGEQPPFGYIDEAQQLERRLQESLAEDIDNESPDVREGRRLAQHAHLGAYIREAVDGKRLDGAALEYRQAHQLPEGSMPWAMLLPVQHRADTATPGVVAGISQAEVLGRVFADTAASYLGVSMPMVSPGQASYPVLTTGLTAGAAAEGAAFDATAAAFNVFNLAPLRLTGGALFSVEDAATLSGMESALATDLRAQFAEQMDSYIIAGTGSSPEPSGFLSELPDPTDPTVATTYAGYAAAAAGAVDGRYASTSASVRLLVNADTYQHVSGLYQTNGEMSALEAMQRNGGGVRVSAHMPAASSNISKSIRFASSGAPVAVAPVWEGIRLIRDEVTNAAAGQVRLTAVGLWNFKIVRETEYAIVEFKSA